MTKQEARTQMKKMRQELSKAEREERNQRIFERLMQLECMKRAKWFFPFVSYGTEVDTLPMITYILENTDTKVAVPRVNGKDMDFYEIQSLSQLQEGYCGILEPVTQDLVKAEHGVMLLPGLAFDVQKNRVGYGGGFYDRYLESCQHTDLHTVAIAYDFQVVATIGAERFDRKPDLLLTDKRVI